MGGIVRKSTHIYVHTHLSTMYTHTHVLTHACTNTHTHTHTNTHTHTHVLPKSMHTLQIHNMRERNKQYTDWE